MQFAEQLITCNARVWPQRQGATGLDFRQCSLQQPRDESILSPPDQVASLHMPLGEHL